MKTLSRITRGVTLLEVMLVLAIAAMIIVMSVRYYQTATSNQQANAVLSQVQSISAAADQLAQASGKFDNADNPVSTDSLKPLLPTNGLVTPWGTDITIGTVTATGYTIEITGAPAGVCPLVKSKLAANNRYDVSGVTCDADAASDMSVVYQANI